MSKPKRTGHQLQNPGGNPRPENLSPRELMLQAAGINPEASGAYLKIALETMADQCDATTHKNMGSARDPDYREVPDNPARRAAAESLMQFSMDLVAEAASGPSGGPVQVNINMESLAPAEPTDVTPES